MELLSGVHLVGLTSTNFAFGFMIANQGLLLAPREAERLFPGGASIAMVVFAMSSGVAQLIGPAVGRWSDSYRAAECKRLPCLVKAAVATVVMTALLPIVSSMQWSYVFMASFLLQQLSWMALQTVQVALVPDLVPEEQRGTAGGLVAALTLGGAFTGLLAVRFISHQSDDVHKTVDYVHYYIAMGLTLFCAALAVLTARSEKVEQSREYLFSAHAAPATGTWFQQLQDCYKFDWERHPEFAKLLLSKACYSANVMIKGFLLFFVQDTFHFTNAANEQVLVGNVSIAAEAMAGVAAGLAILHLGSTKAKAAEGDTEVTVRAQKIAIAGAAWMAMLWFGPPAIGLGVLRGTQGSSESAEIISQRWQLPMVLGTAIWGLGQGIYLAGDQTLGYSLLPDKNEASRYLGLTGLFSALGGIVGSGIAGNLLHVFGSIWEEYMPTQGDGPNYGYPGYLALFLFAVLVNALSCGILCTINPNTNTLSEATRLAKGMKL